MKKITLLICVLCAFVVNTQAQVPNQFNYQAVARNSIGQSIANANIKTKFTILDGSTTGTNVYSEVRSLTTNQLGLFTAAIGGSGATNVTGNFATIDWSTGKKFIKVEVDPLGGTNFITLGNTEMLSVPYALYAVNGKIGPVGPPNVLTIGTVTTGNTGSPASATITGTSPAQTLNLILPTGAQGPQGIQGVQGFKSLLKTTPELPGGNCSTGGQKIESGIDVNNNNILDAAEIISTQFVCNGIQGFKTLLKTTTETAGANCTTGGQKIESGVDLNNNNVLDPAEVTSIAYTCNGAVGPQGFKSLLNTTVEASGANCAAGGQKIETGIDLNNNNILDPAEVTSTSYACNGDVNNAWKLSGNAGTAPTDFIGTTDNKDLTIKTNNTDAIKILANGNVGIGTAAPTSKLEVNGASILANNSTINPNNYTDKVMAGRISDGIFTLANGIAGKQTNLGSTWALGSSGNEFIIGTGNGNTINSTQVGLQIKNNRNILIAPVSGNVGIGGNGVPGSTLTVFGSISHPVRYSDLNTILTDNDHTLICDLLNNPTRKFQVVLPTPTASMEGREYRIVVVNAPTIELDNLIDDIGGYVKVNGNFSPLVYGNNSLRAYPHKLYCTHNVYVALDNQTIERTSITYMCLNGKWVIVDDSYFRTSSG